MDYLSEGMYSLPESLSIPRAELSTTEYNILKTAVAINFSFPLCKFF